MTVHNTNEVARKLLERSIGKEAVRRFVASHGRRMVISDFKEYATAWEVFIVPQVTLDPNPTPRIHRIIKTHDGRN